jgi:hypothetical protein
VHGLLGRTTLAINGGCRNRLREACSDPTISSDVIALFAYLGDAASDHVIDSFWINTSSLNEMRE